MFDLDQFIEDCTTALRDPQPKLAVKEIMSRAVADPASVAAALPPTRAELVPLHSSSELTILKVVWAPGMSIPPHDHLMWAAIGIYGGREDNTFFRRSEAGLVTSGARELDVSEVTLLGHDTIHAVVNPLQRSFTGAIHIYGGDFMNKTRSMWDPDTLVEGPADGAASQRLFEEANVRG